MSRVVAGTGQDVDLHVAGTFAYAKIPQLVCNSATFLQPWKLILFIKIHFSSVGKRDLEANHVQVATK